MSGRILHTVYEFVNQLIHWDDSLHYTRENNAIQAKRCPVTGLDISMQPKNSKFLSFSGVRWYYEHDRKIFNRILEPLLTASGKKKDLPIQFRAIAHNIRNAESNPRNNTKRAIQRLINEKNSLFNNLMLIDEKKLREAGMVLNQDN